MASIVSHVICGIAMRCAMSPYGASCHLRTTCADGLGKTTVTEFLFRHAGMPSSLKRLTAYSAISQTPADDVPETVQPLLLERVPNYQWREGVTRTRKRGIQHAHVLDGPGDPRHVFTAGKRDAAGKRRTQSSCAHLWTRCRSRHRSRRVAGRPQTAISSRSVRHPHARMTWSRPRR